LSVYPWSQFAWLAIRSNERPGPDCMTMDAW
jgi:hypothetical protein